MVPEAAAELQPMQVPLAQEVPVAAAEEAEAAAVPSIDPWIRLRRSQRMQKAEMVVLHRIVLAVQMGYWCQMR